MMVLYCVAGGDIAEAARAYRMLPEGLYPDIDPRNGLKEARGLMSELIQRGLGGAALQLAGGWSVVCWLMTAQRTAI